MSSWLSPKCSLIRSIGSPALSPAATIQEVSMSVVTARNAIPNIRFGYADVDGVRVFYREAGAADAPVLLLLHGFPTSSHMFRELFPRLAQKYRLIAPDLPGFGFTEVPSSRHYRYTFDSLAATIGALVDALSLARYAIYVFDYGAPTGFRLALARPDQISAIVSQNGNAYEEGLGAPWAPFIAYWKDPSPQNRDAIADEMLSFEGTKFQYLHGVADPTVVAPEAYTLDFALLERPGNREAQLSLILDYGSNVPLYPKFQEYFRRAKPPTLAIWGKNDPFFIPPGAEAYRRDNPNAVVRFLDTGHFALETHPNEIAAGIDELMQRV
jgi:pimeloyl-ACP methyl ester carboxylesterase